MTYQFEIKMEVRDYECDLQGIVNNANYLHYLEHTRHKFLMSKGVDFAELHNKGIDVVVARMNLQYKVPLRSNDEFFSRLNVEKDGLRYIFHQDIYRASDNKLSIRATVEAVSIVNGRLANAPECDRVFSS